MVARIDRTPRDAVMLSLLLALIAIRYISGESLLHEVLKTGGIVREFAVEIADRVSQVGWYRLASIHGKISMPFLLRDVKG